MKPKKENGVGRDLSKLLFIAFIAAIVFAICLVFMAISFFKHQH